MDSAPKKLVINSKTVFTPKTSNISSKKALLFVPDLSLNGAQTVLLSLARILIDISYSVTLISSEDGEYREQYLSIGVTIAIRPYISCSEDFKAFLRNEYDLVLLNSSSCLPYIYYFINTNTRVIWWLHETKEQLENTSSYIPAPQLLSPNITIAAAHNSVQQGLNSIFNFKVPILPIPVWDEFVNGYSQSAENRSAVFFIPAAYSYIKGQDILLKAISLLPKDYLSASKFVFCGYSLPGQAEYFNKITSMANTLPNVSLLNSLPKSKVYEYYRTCDCVIAPSRIDSGPASIAEAMMFNRLTLVSSNAGISNCITDCVNGFVFKNEDELFQRLLLIIKDKTNLGSIAANGRITYEINFSPETVKKALFLILSQ